MKQLIEFELEGGGIILVETEISESEQGTERVSRGGEVEKATRTFDDALTQIKPAAQKVIGMLRSLVDPPDEIGVEFGIKFGAKAGAIIASTDVEANYRVTLKWQQAKARGPQELDNPW